MDGNSYPNGCTLKCYKGELNCDGECPCPQGKNSGTGLVGSSQVQVQVKGSLALLTDSNRIHNHKFVALKLWVFRMLKSNKENFLNWNLKGVFYD